MRGRLTNSKGCTPSIVLWFSLCFVWGFLRWGGLTVYVAQASLLDLSPGPSNHSGSSLRQSSVDYFST